MLETSFPSLPREERVTAKIQHASISMCLTVLSVSSRGVNPGSGWHWVSDACNSKNADPEFLSFLPLKRFLIGDRTVRLLLK